MSGEGANFGPSLKITGLGLQTSPLKVLLKGGYQL